MPALTKAQQQLYDWLIAYTRQQEPTPETREITPSIREMVAAMGLKSTSAIQHRLHGLNEKGYIEWLKTTGSRSRRTRIRISVARAQAALAPVDQGLPILGTIAAGLLVEPFTDQIEHLDLPDLFRQPGCFVLRVRGDSMIDDHILPDDFVILQSVADPQQIRNGTVVAALVQGKTTLKRVYREAGDRMMLKPANPRFQPISVKATDLEIQGILVGVWRLAH